MELKEIVNSSETSKAMFKSFSNRARFRRHTDIPYFIRTLSAEGNKIKPDDLLIAFKRMSDLGLGTLVYGRGKNPTRFIWNYNLKDVAMAAQGKKKLEDAQKLDSKVTVLKPKVMTKATGPKPSISVEGEIVTLTIPRDTVSKETILKAIELLFGT